MSRVFIVVDILFLIFFIAVFRLLPPEVPLFFSFLSEEQQLVKNYLLPLPIVLANVFFLLNRFLSQRFFPDKLDDLKKLLDYVNLFLLFFSIYTVVRIIFLIL